MSDRELLELAAKAVGIEFVSMEKWPHQDGCRFWREGDCCDCGAAWNPLTDDGDALRLAVKLRMNVAPEYVYEGPWLDGGSLRDPYAATRRAIVRAAAEIGKAMK